MDLSMFLTESSFSSALIHVRCKGKNLKTVPLVLYQHLIFKLPFCQTYMNNTL